MSEREWTESLATFAERELGDVIASLDDSSDAAIGAMVRRQWNRIAQEAADVP
jgi:hypothetical protein